MTAQRALEAELRNPILTSRQKWYLRLAARGREAVHRRECPVPFCGKQRVRDRVPCPDHMREFIEAGGTNYAAGVALDSNVVPGLAGADEPRGAGWPAWLDYKIRTVPFCVECEENPRPEGDYLCSECREKI